jgi:aminopeptidase N
MIVSAVKISACDYDPNPGLSVWSGYTDNKFLKSPYTTRPNFPAFDSTHSFDALHYSLTLNLPMADNYFEGEMNLSLRVVDNSLDKITLHMIHLIADSALVHNNPGPFERTDSTITIQLGQTYTQGESLSVTVYYHDYSDHIGFYYYTGLVYTMSEPQDARYWFPCFDEPWDKATSDIKVIVPEGYEVGSNGLLESHEFDPSNDTEIYHWVNNEPISTYLMNIVVADYAVWTDYGYSGDDTIPIYNMVYHQDSANAVIDFETTPDMIEIFSDLFGPYPFVKYGHGVVSPYHVGAMEHQTMTTVNRSWMRGDRSTEGGVAHELAHMWWGDYVTLADWKNIWLNEGFATYSSALFNEVFYGHHRLIEDLNIYREIYFNMVRDWGFTPIYDPDYLFSNRVYFKGAWVLHMLRGIIGDEAFFDGLKYYASLYAYGNANTYDFESAMEEVSGMELSWFISQWVYETGYPYYKYSWEVDGDGPYNINLIINQSQLNAPPLRMPIDIRIFHSDGFYNYTIENNSRYSSYDFTIDNYPDSVLLDPEQWILREVEMIPSIYWPGDPTLPERVELSNPYPNPFNNSVTITFLIHGPIRNIDLAVYDILGRKVSTIVSGILGSGYHTYTWDGSADSAGKVSSGIYILKLDGGTLKDSKRITFLK